ncbi:MAG: hypothetical protein C0594_15700, partial [Marinilabiliales bacterium]
VHWVANASANNSTGFTALGSGFYYDGYMYFRQQTYFWTSTISGGDYKAYTMNAYNSEIVESSVSNYSNTRFSLRCVKD